MPSCQATSFTLSKALFVSGRGPLAHVLLTDLAAGAAGGVAVRAMAAWRKMQGLFTFRS